MGRISCAVLHHTKKLCLTLQTSAALAPCPIILFTLTTIIALSHIRHYLARCLSTPAIPLLLQFLFHPLFQGWTSPVHPEHQTLFMVSWKWLRTGTSGMTKSLDRCQNSVRCHNLLRIKHHDGFNHSHMSTLQGYNKFIYKNFLTSWKPVNFSRRTPHRGVSK